MIVDGGTEGRGSVLASADVSVLFSDGRNCEGSDGRTELLRGLEVRREPRFPGEPSPADKCSDRADPPSNILQAGAK